MTDPAGLAASEFLHQLAPLPGARTFGPLGEPLLKILPADAKQALQNLPPLHRELLQQTNGLFVWSGYFRLFGFGYSPTGAPDAFIWNLPNMWKFTWPGHCATFFCFGEDGWGNQYAYRFAGGAVEPKSGIFRLNALTLTSLPIADTFEQFLMQEILANAREPRDVKLAQAAARLGPLAADQQIGYMPSPFLGGQPTLENIRLLQSRQNMILNGDIFSQISAAQPGSTVIRVDSANDQLGVMRLKLVFAPPAAP